MTPSLEALWSRIANHRPRLRDSVRIYRHRYRGRRWYVLRDTATGRWQRLSAEAYRVVRLLDGRHTLAAVQSATAPTGAAPSTTDAELVQLLDGLNQAELIDWGVAENARALHERADAASRKQRFGRALSPLSMRLRLLDPDEFLDSHAGLARLLFSLPSLVLMSMILAAGATAAVLDWPAVAAYWTVRGLAAHSFVLLPLVYLVMKTVHELAHALAVKRWGGEVHEMGIVLLLLMPIPYVDASSAWAFADKYRRMLVGAAGILAELVLAAIAMLLFFVVEEGLVKDFAYTAMLLGTVSTLLFNGNPLLRFDGYYVLADAIEIPNLAPRASRYWAYLAQRYAFGIKDAQSPVAARATLYRIAIVLGIALLVAEAVPALGIALAVWVLLGQMVWPLVRYLRYVVRAPQLAGRRRQALVVSGAVLALSVTLMVAVPMPLTTSAEGVVWLPESGHARADADGTVTELLFGDDGFVSAGDPLARIENPLLNGRIAALEWDLREARRRRSAARVEDPVQVQVLDQTIARFAADLEALRTEAAALTVTSPTSGRLVVRDANALEGRFVRKGDVIAYVLEHAAPTVRVALPQADAGRLRQSIRSVRVRLVEYPRTTLAADIQLEVPSATHALPSAALGATGGGRITVDPTQSDGTRAMERLFLLDLVLREQPSLARVGGRALVRFEHDPEPVAVRLYHAVRQLLLTRLAV